MWLLSHLEKQRLDLDSPLARDVLDNLLNLGGDSLPIGEKVLEVARAYDVAQSSLSAFDEGLADISDTESGLREWENGDQLGKSGLECRERDVPCAAH